MLKAIFNYEIILNDKFKYTQI